MEVGDKESLHLPEGILIEKVPAIIGTYQKVLEADSAHFERTDLAQTVEEELKPHLEQLETLLSFLADFQRNPADFEARVQQVSQEDGSFKARFKRRADSAYGAGEEKSQTQINFFACDRLVFESEDEATEAISLQGKSPQRTIETRDRQLARSLIAFNTLKVFLDPQTGRTKIIPQAGVQVSLVSEAMRFYGVKYVGTQPHLHEITPVKGDFNQEDYDFLKKMIVGLSGYRRPSKSSR